MTTENSLSNAKELRWRFVVDSDDKYEVSSCGKVRKTGSYSHIKITSNDRGYLCCGVLCNGKRKIRKIHIMVAEAFIGSRPDGCELTYRDGDKSNCDVSNLRYGTPKENAESRLLGSVAPSAKLNVENVKKIRILISGGVKLSDVADMCGTSYANVKSISRGRTWARIK